MRYSKQFKLKCVELYKQGKYPKTPDIISTKRFHKTVTLLVSASVHVVKIVSHIVFL